MMDAILVSAFIAPLILQLTDKAAAYIAAGLAVGIAGFGAGLGLGTASAAAIGALVENPKLFGKTFIYIVFIEAIAMYGLVVAFMLILMV
ncbi:ATPase [archaeon]|nr:MAG: ATPase [archaeon]RLG66187.1 MAG: ATPase [archaeon]HDM24145.1 ATPase [Candidatus Bathyarchaeota archaeon]